MVIPFQTKLEVNLRLVGRHATAYDGVNIEVSIYEDTNLLE